MAKKTYHAGEAEKKVYPTLSHSRTLPLGRIVSEQTANAFVFTLPGAQGDQVLMKLNSVRSLDSELIIADNGCGLSEIFDIQDSDSLELKLLVFPEDFNQH